MIRLLKTLRVCPSRDALSILSHISADDRAQIGFNEYFQPGNLVITTIMVPPPVARPAIMASEGVGKVCCS